MSRRARAQFVRAWHHRLGPVVGVQLLLWSLGGIYFSWVHVASEPAEAASAPVNLKYENYLALVPSLIRNSQLEQITDIQLGKLLNTPVYRFIQDSNHAETYNAINGDLLSPLDSTTAVAVALADLFAAKPVRRVERVTQPSGQYRSPLPAWKVSFSDWKATALYVSAHTGLVTARRSAIWRLYDVLWWLPFSNNPAGEPIRLWIVRVSSLLGLVTVAAGFYLWYLTTPLLRSRPKPTSLKKERS